MLDLYKEIAYHQAVKQLPFLSSGPSWLSCIEIEIFASTAKQVNSSQKCQVKQRSNSCEVFSNGRKKNVINRVGYAELQ